MVLTDWSVNTSRYHRKGRATLPNTDHQTEPQKDGGGATQPHGESSNPPGRTGGILGPHGGGTMPEDKQSMSGNREFTTQIVAAYVAETNSRPAISRL
jgi:hypothetical protein